MTNRKSILLLVICIGLTFGDTIVSDYISGSIYGDNSAFCREYCRRGQVCKRSIGDKQNPTCTPYCGDGIVVAGKEECDDGNKISGDGCSGCKRDPFYLCSGEPSVCKWSCGNGILDPNTGQVCDNGNSTTIDGCSDSCQVVDHWQCTNVDGQRSDCHYVPWCGDGFTTAYADETCDDANNIDGDGCTNCKVDKFYICTTDIRTVPYSSCPSTCHWSCGNHIYQPEAGEECDNGNSTKADGCSDGCKVVSPYWTCTNVVHQRSQCNYVPRIVVQKVMSYIQQFWIILQYRCINNFLLFIFSHF